MIEENSSDQGKLKSLCKHPTSEHDNPVANSGNLITFLQIDLDEKDVTKQKKSIIIQNDKVLFTEQPKQDI